MSGWRFGTSGEFDWLVAVVELHVKVGTESLRIIIIMQTITDKKKSNPEKNSAHRKSIILGHSQIKNFVELHIFLRLHFQVELLDEGHVGDDLMRADAGDDCLLLLERLERLEAEAIFLIPEFQRSFLAIILLNRKI